MRRIRVEHTLTDVANLAQIIDVDTEDLVSRVISLDLNLTAGDPAIRGILTRYIYDSKGRLASDRITQEPLTYTEEVIVLYVSKFDQSAVAIIE